MEHAARTKLLTAVVLALVFGSGVLLGYAADRNIGAEDAEVRREGETTEGSRNDGERRRRRFVYEQLSPTPAQQIRIDSIMQAQRERMDWLRTDFEEARRVYRKDYDAVVQDLREGIASVFPPDEAAEYRRLLAESDRRRAEERATRDGRD